MKEKLYKNWKYIAGAVIIIILIGAFTGWFGLSKKFNYPNLPEGIDKKQWRAKYEEMLNNLLNLKAGEYRNSISSKARQRGISYEAMAHIDAVYLTNQKFGTQVKGSEWLP